MAEATATIAISALKIDLDFQVQATEELQQSTKDLVSVQIDPDTDSQKHWLTAEKLIRQARQIKTDVAIIHDRMLVRAGEEKTPQTDLRTLVSANKSVLASLSDVCVDLENFQRVANGNPDPEARPPPSIHGQA